MLGQESSHHVTCNSATRHVYTWSRDTRVYLVAQLVIDFIVGGPEHIIILPHGVASHASGVGVARAVSGQVLSHLG